MRLLLPAVVAFGLLATPVLAAEPAKPTGLFLDVQPIGFPAVVKGRLVNYIFASIRLNLRPGTDIVRVQSGEPTLRDALVRAGSRTPFNPPGDGVHLDEARLTSTARSLAQAQYGAGTVTGVAIRSQTPQRRFGVPGAR
jgi:hypothetical protein